MESTYINTGHPDFISGHKAMAIVNQRVEANKPQQNNQIDPRSSKLPPGAVNNNKDLDVDIKQQDQGFFGSFWQGNKNQAANKKKMSAMEAVSASSRSTRGLVADPSLCSNLSLHLSSRLLVSCPNERIWRLKSSSYSSLLVRPVSLGLSLCDQSDRAAFFLGGQISTSPSARSLIWYRRRLCSISFSKPKRHCKESCSPSFTTRAPWMSC